MNDKVEIGKEADHHPYKRPRDAATLMLVDRSGPIPKVLVGKRHDKVVFMPGKFVFPGGSVDTTDNKIPVAAPLPPELEANLMKGSPKTPPSRARSLAVAAIREACEETGLCLGRKVDGATRKLPGVWEAFSDAGLLPDPSGLFLIARAITPPGRIKRFDTRFFTADASSMGRTRLRTSRRRARNDEERAQSIAAASRHRPAPSRRATALLPLVQRQDATRYAARRKLS
jgi:8-oxo-dGTP pyrophosphatase MutT (NUDIX family)